VVPLHVLGISLLEPVPGGAPISIVMVLIRVALNRKRSLVSVCMYMGMPSSTGIDFGDTLPLCDTSSRVKLHGTLERHHPYHHNETEMLQGVRAEFVFGLWGLFLARACNNLLRYLVFVIVVFQSKCGAFQQAY